MAEKTYISRIARYQIVMRPTRRVDGQLVPGKVIVFNNNRYTTADPEEQKAIESSIDFGRLIFVDGEAPQPVRHQRQDDLRIENQRLTQELAELRRQLAELQKAKVETAETRVEETEEAPKAKTKSKPKTDDKPKITIPDGQKCEEPGCSNDAVTENDGMFVCAEHAV